MGTVNLDRPSGAAKPAAIMAESEGRSVVDTRVKCHKEEGMKITRILACLCFILGAVSLASSQSLVTVYSNGFDSPVESEWSSVDFAWSKYDLDETPNGVRTFLGEYGGEPVTLDLYDLPEHCSVTITFDLLIINSWEGSVGWNAGPDIWDLDAFTRDDWDPDAYYGSDDCCPVQNLIHTTFANCECKYQAYPQSYPDVHHPGWTGAAEINTLGYRWRDSVYKISVSFFHDAENLTFRFSATPELQYLEDESWGIDNLTVEMDTDGLYCCRATRKLPIAYGNDYEVPVAIDVSLNPNAQTHVIEEKPPLGWSVSNINDGGVFEGASGKIKWGPFYGTQARILSYTASPPSWASGTYTFSGSMVVDGESEEICGIDTIDPGSFHPVDLDSDWKVSATEFTAYGAAWKKGDPWSREPNPIPADYVTNAGMLWKNGEWYYYAPWEAPPWASSGRKVAGEQPEPQPAKAEVKSGGLVESSFSSYLYDAGTPIQVSIAVTPEAGTIAYAVEDTPPQGWIVDDISAGGTYDIGNGKVKWGIFFDDSPQTLTYSVIPAIGAEGTISFSGLGSFDGVSVPITGHRYLGPASFSGFDYLVPAAAHVSGLAGSSWRSDLGIHNRGESLTTYTISLLKADMDNTARESITFTLNAGMSVRYDDVLAELFDFDGAAALLITASSEDVIITSRTYTLSEDGTFGQAIPGEPITKALTTGEEARLVQLSHSADSGQGFRTNVGFASISNVPITVTLDFYNREGTHLDTLNVELEPFEFHQENSIFKEITSLDVDNAYIAVRSDTAGAKLFAYASIVDNLSNDSFYQKAY
jgi:hypothetical protein